MRQIFLIFIKALRSLLTSRGLLFVGMMLSVALLLFWEGKRYEMGRSDGRAWIDGRCYTR